MQSLKSFLLEGLIQAALLLSLCGVRVQVEPERSLLELGPTSALPPVTHTQLHNLRNIDFHNLRNTDLHDLRNTDLHNLRNTDFHDLRNTDLHNLRNTDFHDLRNTLEEADTGLHPKSPDLDQFFTARRLLGWVRSLDRLQVPQTELETWLVQQDPAPLPVRLLHSAPDRLVLPQQTSRGQEQLWEEPEVEPEEPAEERDPSQDRRHEETADRNMSPSEATDWDEGDTTEGQTEEDQSTASLQECLRLLESFPLTPEQQEQVVCNPGAPSTDAPPAVAQSPPSDMEQHWQDLMDLMEPQSSDVELLHLLEPGPEHQRPLMDGFLQHDLTGPRSDPELLPLVPSDELDDPTAAPLLPDNLPPSFMLDERELAELLGDSELLEDMGLLQEEEGEEQGFSSEMTHRLQEEGFLDPELTRRTSRLSLSVDRSEEIRPDHTTPADVPDELDSDSGLSLDSSQSPPSPSDSEASSYSSSSSSSSSSSAPRPSPMELEVTIKKEPLDEEEELVGAVGGHSYNHQNSKLVFSNFYPDQKLFDSFPWQLQQVTHDHTYNQASEFSPKISSRASPKHEKPYSYNQASQFSPKISSRTSLKRESPYTISKHLWSRDERRARAFKIPISNELIVNLPVEEFNDLLARYRLDENQLTLIRDIRRRGKNKIAAQNCRKRKMDTLVGLERDVVLLRRRRSKLLKEKQDALRSLQELKQTVTRLYRDVFSGLRDSEGRPLDVNEYMLSFERDGSVDVVSRRRDGKDKSRRKQRDKK